ncbi:UNKNOWN [Stylonychia lemnae]|uniref:CRAL-TRIO domain-containing protein n=1 Tax=Stylonychia lemnae TaxID=5949 RepID=A0A078A7A8_STYLE|nr:UNKNOWN [Stylonychia lemnae]|eukprot:CDW77417.1 UNKNOWN [Stylonychia lemnae]
MGNNCCSNEARKAEGTQRTDVDQFFENDGLTTPPPHGYFQGLGAMHSSQSSSNSLLSMERHFTMNKLMRKEDKNRQMHKLRIYRDDSKSSSAIKTPKAQSTRKQRSPSPTERNNRLQLLKSKQAQQRLIKNAVQEFDHNMYGKSTQQLISKTLVELVNETKDINNAAIKRYDMAEIRKFLISSSWNPQIACKKIIQDIEWRNQTFPINDNEIYNMIKSQHVIFCGTDRELCPCLYIRPNHRETGAFFKQGLNAGQYKIYLCYILDQILPQLSQQQGFTNKVSIVYDIENGDFRLDILEIIEDLILNHFPQRLHRIFIVKIGVQNITQKVKTKFQQKFYKNHTLLFDENYMLNLGKFFDPQELLREYGGHINSNRDQDRIGLSQNNVEEYILDEFQQVYPEKANLMLRFKLI